MVELKKQDTMSKDYIVDTFDGTIEYGEYSQTYWYGLHSINNPIWKWIQQRIINETPHQDKFDICIAGGLLEDWVTWDADIFIFGKYQPKEIREVLDSIVRIGFEEHFYLDVTWQNKFWPIHKCSEWVKNEVFISCELSNYFSKDGVVSDFSHYKKMDGLYRKANMLPFQKHWDNLTKGYSYHEPIFLKK